MRIYKLTYPSKRVMYPIFHFLQSYGIWYLYGMQTLGFFSNMISTKDVPRWSGPFSWTEWPSVMSPALILSIFETKTFASSAKYLSDLMMRMCQFYCQIIHKIKYYLMNVTWWIYDWKKTALNWQGKKFVWFQIGRNKWSYVNNSLCFKAFVNHSLCTCFCKVRQRKFSDLWKAGLNQSHMLNLPKS